MKVAETESNGYPPKNKILGGELMMKCQTGRKPALSSPVQLSRRDNVS